MPRKATKKAPSVSMAQLVSAVKKASISGKGAYKPRSAPRRAVRGRGFYKGFGADLGRALGKGASMLTGVQGLDEVGRNLGSWGSSKTGFGAYNLRHNSLVPEVPSITNPHKEGATQVRHKEYIGDIIVPHGSTGAFTIEYVLPLNAGMSDTFPWLSNIASNFTQWEMNGCLVEFVSQSGELNTSGSSALGNVMLSTNYDSVLPAFTNKQQMLNQEFSISVKPSVNGLHAIECANNQTTIPLLYTRTGAVPSTSSQQLYDLGVCYVAYEGIANTTGVDVVVGEVWITYDILLYKPLLAPTR